MTGVTVGSGFESDDNDLLSRAQMGDRAALEELFKTFYPKLVRVVRRKLEPRMRSLYDSTDFASDVWGSLLAKFDELEFRSVDALMGFLAKSASDKVIDKYRMLHTQKRDVTRQTSLDIRTPDGGSTPLPLPSDAPTASQEFIAKETYDLVLLPLDEVGRRVIELKLQGYSTEEISKKVDWNVRKVQRLLKQHGAKFGLGDTPEAPEGS